ncbi:FAD-dependent oxidoreductase [Actinomycetospora sp. CA-101289]|uniref:FAD-dependent oxidoreductase n=1 Tax=Actinomycetospora sp. CA-101289 TaxID=3239893 RepID=UPI003D974FE7
MERTTCVVVGGGPAGIVLGLLLARAGVTVTVLEKHADFLRDFRGDTVHPSTMTLIDELGLWPRFARLPWKPIETTQVVLDAGSATLGDLRRLRRLGQPHPFVAMVPQWHLLDMLAGAAEEEPGFTLVRDAEVVDLRRAGGRVTGVRWRDRSSAGGAEHELAADLVVACDGRGSRVRELSGLPVHDFPVPMDVWWFRLPRGDGTGDPAGGIGRVSDGRLVVMLDRGDHYQVAYLIPRGADAAYRRQPVQVLRDDMRRLHPWLGDRVDGLRSWDDVKLLAVTLDRLRRWSAPGVLCVGDAAHAMSPIGGVGINLAVQDAVAAARYLGPLLACAPADPAAVDRAAARVQRRRWLPTAATQAAQRVAHRVVVRAVLGATAPTPGGDRLPAPLRLLRRVPALQVVPAYLVGVGVLPERAPMWARRGAQETGPQDAGAKNSSALPSGSVKDSAQP